MGSSNYCSWTVILRFHDQNPQISIEMTLLYTKLYFHLKVTSLLKYENEDRVYDCPFSNRGGPPRALCYLLVGIPCGTGSPLQLNFISYHVGQ